MLTKAISWMKSLIASPTPRGVPVSLVRPWIWSLFYIRFRYQINSSSLTSTLDEMIDLESCISLPAVFFHHRPILESVVCLHTTVSCPPLCIIWRACNNLVEQPQFDPVIYFMLLAYCIKKLSTSEEDFSHTGLKRLVSQ